MKHWQETAAILDRLAALSDADRRAAVATVVEIQGSAYRRPGAKLLVEDDGTTLGSVSGGCLESDVREVALEVIRQGVPRRLHYETGSDEDRLWGLGLGCNGAVDLFVQPTDPDYLEIAAMLGNFLRGNDCFAIATIIEGPGGSGRIVAIRSEGALTGSTDDADLDRQLEMAARRLLDERRSVLHSVGSSTVFTEVQVPPPYLLICGGGDDAIPLVSYAARVGFRVIVADHRPAYLSAERFPEAWRRVQVEPARGSVEGLPLQAETYAVVKTHNLGRDREWVQSLLSKKVRYVGLLGPRDRKEEILAELGIEDSRQVYGPVGLDIGAEGPEQVALSIVSELLAVRSGRGPCHLRERPEAIHATS